LGTDTWHVVSVVVEETDVLTVAVEISGSAAFVDDSNEKSQRLSSTTRFPKEKHNVVSTCQHRGSNILCGRMQEPEEVHENVDRSDWWLTKSGD
jgi:hypothetical protein